MWYDQSVQLHNEATNMLKNKKNIKIRESVVRRLHFDESSDGGDVDDNNTENLLYNNDVEENKILKFLLSFCICFHDK